MDRSCVPFARQFTLGYLLGEVGLIAVALAAGRIAWEAGDLLELKAGLCCVAVVASCGALGGLCLRMAVGLVAGGVFAVASIPLLVVLLGAAAR
jgi:hypothetical protein